MKPTIQQVKLVTGHEVFHCFPPIMPGPMPMVYGEGLTKQQALADCKARFEKDKVGACWNGLIDWSLWEQMQFR